ncbi:hypothetical protein LCGC14_2218140 [marine sediment metagenome]|uniref:Uncharacterized protein n=1 Tax=marine sediment metagenome TaxID=412755 RepID=A0A0F9G7D2_9ZZZZ
MSFPIVKILCNECGKPMIVSKPELVDSDKEGYDKLMIYRYVCTIDRKSVSMRMYIPDVEVGIAATTTYNPINCNIEDTFFDLAGKPYKPVIKDGLYMCPKCEGHIVPLNPTQHDPDYYYYRCNKCKMDFRIINKADKDFKF